MVEKYQQVKSKKGKPDKPEQQSSSWLSWGSSNKQDHTIEILETGKYGKEWSEAYIEIITERLSINIYNALCIEILHPLKDKLRNTYTSEFLKDNEKIIALLQEKPEIENIRKSLERQVEELEKATKVLENLMK